MFPRLLLDVLAVGCTVELVAEVGVEEYAQYFLRDVWVKVGWWFHIVSLLRRPDAGLSDPRLIG